MMIKKLILIGLLAIGANAFAQTMDTRVYSITTIGTNAGTSAFVLRGELEGIYVDITATKTQAVSVASAFGTAYSGAAVTADTMVYPRVQIANSAGTAQTFVDSNLNTNAIFGKFPLAGTITATVTPAANTTGTNLTTITVIYKP